MGRLSGVEAVTIDAFGTLVELADPMPALGELLRARGVERSRPEVVRAFAAEMAYYRAHAVEGRDEKSLSALRQDCAAVFLDAAGADLSAEEFAPHFTGALEFRLLDGVPDALDQLSGLKLGVVSNWDFELPTILERLGIACYFGAVVTSAEAGSPKPAPRIFELALERLGVPAERAVHVGDDPADEAGAQATGMRFVPAPLANLFEACE
jgi:HAD superfamily hydrolase (TIGR01509 family)